MSASLAPIQARLVAPESRLHSSLGLSSLAAALQNKVSIAIADNMIFNDILQALEAIAS